MYSIGRCLVDGRKAGRLIERPLRRRGTTRGTQPETPVASCDEWHIQTNQKRANTRTVQTHRYHEHRPLLRSQSKFPRSPPTLFPNLDFSTQRRSARNAAAAAAAAATTAAASASPLKKKKTATPQKKKQRRPDGGAERDAEEDGDAADEGQGEGKGEGSAPGSPYRGKAAWIAASPSPAAAAESAAGNKKEKGVVSAM